MNQQPTCPCKWCGDPTPMLGTKMCDRCWELDHRISAQPKLARRMLETFDPNDQGTRIEVAADGVFIGFFAEDGRSAILNISAISEGRYGHHLGSHALRAWVADRKKQAAAAAAAA